MQPRQLFKKAYHQLIPQAARPFLKAAVFKPLYFGTRHHCPTCNANLRQLLPYGYDYPVIKERQIVGAGFRRTKCPVCSSIDRERLIYLYLKHETAVFTKQGQRCTTRLFAQNIDGAV